MKSFLVLITLFSAPQIFADVIQIQGEEAHKVMMSNFQQTKKESGWIQEVAEKMPANLAAQALSMADVMTSAPYTCSLHAYAQYKSGIYTDGNAKYQADCFQLRTEINTWGHDYVQPYPYNGMCNDVRLFYFCHLNQL